MKHTIIGTAGHVDHGKTALIRALTGIDTDRLAEEKKRGITIDLGFAWLKTPDGNRIGIVDVPGHERFVKNMLAGAGGINLALLVIAADDGVMPQTREHLDILRLLDIHEGIIVLTKADLVESDWIDIVAEDVRELVRGTFLERAPLMAVSSHTGDGIEALRGVIFERLATAANTNIALPFRIPVDRVFTSGGFGTVVTGTLIEGALSEGDEVEVYPSGLRSRVRNLQVHGEPTETAWAGQRVAVNLAGLRRDQLSRRDTVAAPGSMENSLLLDVQVSVLKSARRTLRNGSRLHFFHGAGDTLCRLSLLGAEDVPPGGEAYAQLRFEEPVATRRGDAFVLRFYSPVETVGGGKVLDPNPVRHRRSDEGALRALEVRARGTDEDALLQALRDTSPSFGQLSAVEKGLSMDPDAFRSALSALLDDGRAIRLSGKTVIAADYLRTLGTRLDKLLRDYHAANPLHAGMRRDELRSRLLPGREISLTDKVLSLYEAEGRIAAHGQKVALQDFTVCYSPLEQRLSEALLAAYAENRFMPPSESEALARFPRERAAAKRVLEALLDTGRLTMVAPQMAFLSSAVDEALSMLSAFAAEHGQITLAQFRDMIGASRKFALSLLEYFDRQSITRMNGDARVLVKKSRS